MNNSEKKVGKKILVIGVTGSGKTTLSKDLSRRLGLHHVELDSLHWGPNWTAAEEGIFRERVQTALSRNDWVCDGNYKAVREVVWPQADTIIWLEYPLTLIFWRLFWRSIRRIIKRETLWNGNRESFAAQFLNKESLFIWAFKTYFSYRRDYAALLRKPEYRNVAIFHFTHPAQTDAWLTSLAN